MRAVRVIDGVKHLFCRLCDQWKRERDFYILKDPSSKCKRESYCITCTSAARCARARAARAARAAREGGQPKPAEASAA